MTNRVPAALVCAMLAVAASARAQDEATPRSILAGAEVTPYVFLGSNASSGVGAAVRWAVPANFSLELDTSYRRGGAAALSSSANILFHFPKAGLLTPYAAGGIGFDQYTYAERFGTGPVIPRPGTALAINAGGGIHVRAGERWGVRTDARWSNGIGGRAPERLRLFTGVTFGGGGRER